MFKRPHRLGFFFLLPALVCVIAGAVLPAKLPAAEWYLSNAGGMPLEKQSSRLAALRNKYSLSVEKVPLSETPDILKEYHKASWIIEVHILFENGEESRRQWIFRDGKGTARLVAAFDPPAPEDEGVENGEGAPAELSDTVSNDTDESAVRTAPTGTAPLGFIELYDENSRITTERQFFDQGDELIVNYTYNKGVLIRSETWLRSEPLKKNSNDEGEKSLRHINTDYYRYSRSASLRAVERVYHEKLSSDEGYLLQHRFPHRILDSVGEENFVNPALAYGSDFLEDVFIEPGYKVLYTTDERGRILGETREDNEENTIGEVQNVWSGDRLASVTWKSGEDERRTEYDYDSEGDRIEERNYNAGTLERVVRRENKQEVEELYMNGVVILRVVWEDGRKISEERIRSTPGTAGASPEDKDEKH